MARVTTGAITITDVTDGTNPIASFLTNENHTFPADPDGVISAGDMNAFFTLLHVYEGANEITFDSSSTKTDTSLSNSTYRIATSASAIAPKTSLVLTGTGWPLVTNWTVANDATNTKAAKITAPSASASESSADSATLSIPIRIKNAAGAINVIDFVVSFTKAIQGAGGDIVTLGASKQYFTSDFGGTLTASQADITITVGTQGNPGAQKYYTALDGAARSNKTSCANTAGNIKGYKNTGDSSFTTTGTISTSATELLLSQNNLGNTNETVAVTVTGSSDSKGLDVISVAKVHSGQAGIIAVIESNNGSTFKSGISNATKTLSVTIYDSETGEIIDPRGSGTNPDVTFTWYLGSAEGSEVFVASASSRNVVPSSDAGSVKAAGTISSSSSSRFDQVVVDDTDVTNSQQYTCKVSIA